MQNERRAHLNGVSAILSGVEGCFFSWRFGVVVELRRSASAKVGGDSSRSRERSEKTKIQTAVK